MKECVSLPFPGCSSALWSKNRIHLFSFSWLGSKCQASHDLLLCWLILFSLVMLVLWFMMQWVCSLHLLILLPFLSRKDEIYKCALVQIHHSSVKEGGSHSTINGGFFIPWLLMLSTIPKSTRWTMHADMMDMMGLGWYLLKSPWLEVWDGHLFSEDEAWAHLRRTSLLEVGGFCVIAVD